MEGITIIKGKEAGPIVVIMASLHGEEPAGLAAYNYLATYFDNHELERGEIRLIHGNIEAGKKGIRFLKYDLNRMFREDYDGMDLDCYEYRRVLELKLAMEGANHILDLHSMTSEGDAFALLSNAETDYPDYMVNLPVAFNSSGWGGALPGTLMDWGEARGMDYVAIECGLNGCGKSDQTAIDVARAYLNQVGLTDFDFEFEGPQRHLRLLGHTSIKDHESYSYANRQYSSFDEVEPNELIAVDDKGEYRAPNLKNLVIVMPASQESVRNRLNNDAYYLGQFSAI